ncbi:MAG: translation initiation inhibitor [Variovorax paradoxus]|nr:MAG: translation initiation inhibitor [Variovorax paradoxus]PZQ00052.1 MAG: translation initiation inhibitor [Variovorax paradoxus]
MTAPTFAQITRHQNPASLTQSWAREFAESIEIPAAARTIVLSGVGPLVADKTATPDTVASYGDTSTQTRSVLAQIEQTLKARGFGLGDIVTMQALIVGDPKKNGEADFQGFSEVYNLHFGTTAQPNVPARTRAQVIRLVPPGWLVEVTVTAAKAP